MLMKIIKYEEDCRELLKWADANEEQLNHDFIPSYLIDTEMSVGFKQKMEYVRDALKSMFDHFDNAKKEKTRKQKKRQATKQVVF